MKDTFTGRKDEGQSSLISAGNALLTSQLGGVLLNFPVLRASKYVFSLLVTQ